jgi:hypothetical protein
MRARAILLAATLVLAPLGVHAADLVVWWEEGYHPEEDQAVREGHRQVDAGKDREASLTGATALCGSRGTGDLGPDRESLRADGSVLGSGKVIAVKVKEVVDLVVGGEEPLCLAG